MRRLPIILVVWLAALEARSAGVYVEVNGDATFTRADLEAVVSARTTLARESTPDVLVVVITLVGDRAVLEAAGKVQRVDLGGRAGLAAARLLAIAVTDLMADLPTVPTPRAQRERAMVAIWPSAAASGDDLEPTFLGGSLDLSVPVGGWRAALTVSGLRSFEVEPGTSLDALVARAAWGRRFGPLELRGGPLLTVYQAHGGQGHSGTLLGGAAAALLAAHVAGGVVLVVSVGLDGYAQRASFVVDGRSVMATPRVQAWAGLGLGWEWEP